MLGRANVHLVACAAVAGVLPALGAGLLGAATTAAHHAAAEPSAVGAGPLRAGQRLRHAGSRAGSFRVNFGLMVDHLSGTLLLVITGVGFLIHLYSTSYMEHDDGLLALLRVPQPLRRDDADAGDGRQPGPALRGLGGRGPPHPGRRAKVRRGRARRSRNGLKADAPGIPGFFTTVDHKRIGMRYIYTAFVFFFVAGLVALVMRAQLAHAEQQRPRRPRRTTSCSRCTARR